MYVFLPVAFLKWPASLHADLLASLIEAFAQTFLLHPMQTQSKVLANLETEVLFMLLLGENSQPSKSTGYRCCLAPMPALAPYCLEEDRIKWRGDVPHSCPVQISC